MNQMCPENDVIFFTSKRPVFDGGAELVAPPETAGFSGAAADFGADKGPISRSVLFDEFDEGCILLWTPRTFDFGGATTSSTTSGGVGCVHMEYIKVG